MRVCYIQYIYTYIRTYTFKIFRSQLSNFFVYVLGVVLQLSRVIGVEVWDTRPLATQDIPFFENQNLVRNGMYI